MKRLNRPKLGLVAAAFAAISLGACTVAPVGQLQPVGPSLAGPGALRTGCDTRFSLVNQSGVAIREFYFTPSALQGFGANRLGRQFVRPGQSVDFAAGQPGRHDFRIVMADGYRTHRMGADVCGMTRLVMNHRTLSAQ